MASEKKLKMFTSVLSIKKSDFLFVTPPEHPPRHASSDGDVPRGRIKAETNITKVSGITSSKAQMNGSFLPNKR